MKVAVRAASETDIPDLSRLFVQSAAYHSKQAPYFFNNIPPNDWIREFFVGHLKNPKVTLLVALVDSKIVGEIRAELKDTPDIPLIKRMTTLQVEEVVVDDKHRRAGVATVLMQKIEELAKSLGVSQVTLNVWNFNESAKALYHQLGYEVQRSIMKKDL